MKKKEWENPNKMKFESLHKTFNRQCALITTGTQIGNVVYSNNVRPYKEINEFCKIPGELHKHDLYHGLATIEVPENIRKEISELTKENGGIVYHFHHWNWNPRKNGYKRIDDGVVLTTNDHKLIKKWYLNKNYKARDAVDEATKYIAEVE